MSYFPIILKVRLGELKTLIVTMLRRVLRVTLDVAYIFDAIAVILGQKVGECISGTVREISERQQALHIASCGTDTIICLVPLGPNELAPELKRVLAK